MHNKILWKEFIRYASFGFFPPVLASPTYSLLFLPQNFSSFLYEPVSFSKMGTKYKIGLIFQSDLNLIKMLFYSLMLQPGQKVIQWLEQNQAS